MEAIHTQSTQDGRIFRPAVIRMDKIEVLSVGQALGTVPFQMSLHARSSGRLQRDGSVPTDLGPFNGILRSSLPAASPHPLEMPSP